MYCIGLLPFNLKQEADEAVSKRFNVDISHVDPMDIGRFVSLLTIDDTKLNLINNNHWKPPLTFILFPLHLVQHDVNFVQIGSIVGRGCAILSSVMEHCVLFGRETGRNGTKLTKLLKKPLTNWRSIISTPSYIVTP